MRMNKTKVLLVLPSDVLDRARVLAGRATTELRLPVSLQIVLRALIEDGLKQSNSPALLANFERQALAVRDIRRAVHARTRANTGAAAAGRPSHRRAVARRRP
jgi:hypothetical protein